MLLSCLLFVSCSNDKEEINPYDYRIIYDITITNYTKYIETTGTTHITPPSNGKNSDPLTLYFAGYISSGIYENVKVTIVYTVKSNGKEYTRTDICDLSTAGSGSFIYYTTDKPGSFTGDLRYCERYLTITKISGRVVC